MLQEEVWLPIKGFYNDYDGGYLISNYGRLKVIKKWRKLVDYNGNPVYKSKYVPKNKKEISNGTTTYETFKTVGLNVVNVVEKYPKGSVIQMDSAKYLHYYLIAPGSKKGCLKYAHDLVLSTFSPTDDPTLEVNHKDGNKLNNRLDNLEWCTHKYNMHHAVAVLGKKFGNMKGNPDFKTNKQKLIVQTQISAANRIYGGVETIHEIRRLYDEGKLYPIVVRELSLKYGVKGERILMIAERKTYQYV